MSKLIVLCTMVKNEEKVIIRLLDSVKEVISAIALTDTGSTDKTCELAENWAKENGIQIAMFHDKWINFGVSRTKSAMNARSFYPNADYFLLLDGDMILKPLEGYDPNDLKADDYQLEQINHGTHYYNTRLISAKKFYRSISGTHEYWGCPVEVSSDSYDKLKIEDMNDGGSRSDKIMRDRNIFLRGLRQGVTPDYLLGRYSFYIGQTYQGKGNLESSNQWYKKCILHGGWDQQVYYSLYKIAENYFNMKEFKNAIVYSMKAWNYRPIRAEPLTILAKSCICLDMKNMAKLFAEMGKKIPKPNDVLFLDIGSYDGTVFDDILKTI